MNEISRARRKFGVPYHLPAMDATTERLVQILQSLEVQSWEEEEMESGSSDEVRRGEEDVDGNAISRVLRSGNDEEWAGLISSSSSVGWRAGWTTTTTAARPRC